MSKTRTSSPTTETPTSTPRANRGAAAVVAKYIKDLTTPATQDPRTVAA
jgi:hypothetical protein